MGTVPGFNGRRRHYVLVCSLCGAQHPDDGILLECVNPHSPALLQTMYTDPEFNPSRDSDSLFRYRRWLPVETEFPGAGRPIVYRSRALGRFLGLPNLWIAFSGYWPEREANLETCTFKELEAFTVLARAPGTLTTLTVASAGNTAAAFALACSRNHIPCLVVIPERGLRRFAFREPLDPCVRLVVLQNAGYSDAIGFADAIASTPGFHPEGGVKNVARRDALGTVLLAAFEQMRGLPDVYFQAIGSGTGAIAVHEAAKRLRATTADPLPRLLVCQNEPFTPVYDAWRVRRRDWTAKPADQLSSAIEQVHADELTNRTPPYSVHGGLYDALTESAGDVLTAGNRAAIEARSLFEELEGIDIEPAPGVALACLRQAAAKGEVRRDDVVLLNITGGGRRRAAADHELIPAAPHLRLDAQQAAIMDPALPVSSARDRRARRGTGRRGTSAAAGPSVRG